MGLFDGDKRWGPVGTAVPTLSPISGVTSSDAIFALGTNGGDRWGQQYDGDRWGTAGGPFCVFPGHSVGRLRGQAGTMPLDRMFYGPPFPTGRGPKTVGGDSP